MQQGTLDPDWASSIDRFVYSTTYMSYGQGTMLTSLGTVALTPLLGSSNWALQATTIVAEALSVGLVAILLARVLRFRWALLAVALWLFPPARALTWQLLPFGNHSEFLAVPVALAAFVTLRAPGDRAKWEWWVPGLLIVLGVFFYRLNLAAALAFLAVALREPGAELRKRVLVMAGAALGALLFVIDSVTGSLSSAVPKLSAAPSEFLGSSLAIFDQVPVAWNWLALPGPWLLRGLMIGLAGLSRLLRVDDPQALYNLTMFCAQPLLQYEMQNLHPRYTRASTDRLDASLNGLIKDAAGETFSRRAGRAPRVCG